MAEQKYKVMTPEDVSSYKDWAKKKVKEWHDSVKPDYVILTETSAVPLGWTLKSTWKEMYPGEGIPKFYRSNLGQEDGFHMRRALVEDRPEKFKEKYLKKRKIDESKRVLVYDEASKVRGYYDKSKGPSFEHRLDKPVKIVDEEIVKNPDTTLERTASLLKKGGVQDVWVDNVAPENYFKRGYLRDGVKPTSYVKPTRKTGFSFGNYRDPNYVGYNFVGVTEKDPELRKRALAYIHDLKLAGKEAGLEERHEREKKKKLEQIVSGVMGIFGLVSSFFFLGSSVTGNAIGNISSQNSNLIGILLLLFGVIATFLYLKNKRLSR